MRRFISSGNVFDMWPSDRFPDWASGVWEPHVVRAVRENVRPGSVAIDVGAHVGVHAALMAQVCEGGMVMMFEPVPEVAELAESNMRLNGISNYRMIRSALGDRSGAAVAVCVDKGNRGSTLIEDTPMLLPSWSVEAGRWEVLMARMDDYGFKDVSFIKIDVEGYERRVLNGARQTIETSMPVVAFESWRDHYGTPDSVESPARHSCIPLLQSWGYRVTPIGHADFIAVPGDI
jgi:FkbM family methyltransferase